MNALHQCRSCPWRVDSDPDTDIPNGYSRAQHHALRCTIAADGQYTRSALRIMACHYSPVGAEYACAGWLHHQLGEGNNLAARIAVLRGQLPHPVVDGEQHRTFEDTLPKGDL